AAAADVLAAAEHLAACAECRERSAALLSDDEAARLVSTIAGGGEIIDHPDAQSRLYPYVEGTLDRPLTAEVEAHLANCELCAEDVADLRATRVQRRRPARWIAAAAAAVVVAIVAILLIAHASRTA